MNNVQLNCTLRCIVKKTKKYKYIILCLGCVLLLLLKFYSPWKHEKYSSVNLEYVTVHFDLKGAPPKLSYLNSLLADLQIYGVNSILMEYEDMFPYEETLVNISSKNCYTKVELVEFLKQAKSLNIEIIPLVQTFGHMEHVLKLEEFAALRENQSFPAEICPSNPLSITLIKNMISQVINLHDTISPLKHIHIGCDEVYNMNKCSKCRKKKLEDIDLFLDHVKTVSGLVSILNPNINVLFWADMLKSTRKQLRTNVLRNVEAVVWDYSTVNLSHTYFYNLHKQFDNIWIASAFKGADGIDAALPNIKRRFINNLYWMRFILDYKFGGESKVYNFKGIILTGWSRYTHFSVNCELLPTSMPSLFLNLMLIQKLQKGIPLGDLQNMDTCSFFNKHLKSDFENIFECYTDLRNSCSFEKTILYRDYNNTFETSLRKRCLQKLHLHELQYTYNKYTIDPHHLASDFETCKFALDRLVDIKKKLISFMTKYYKKSVIRSYLDEKITIPNDNIKRIMNILQNVSQILHWPQRS